MPPSSGYRRGLAVVVCALLTLSGDAFAIYEFCFDETCAPGDCGRFTTPSGCVLSCGSCPSGQTCSYNYCCAQTTSCGAQGRVCGSVWNGCSTESCGTCPYGRDCNTSGQCDPPKPAETLCDGRQVTTEYAPTIPEMTCGVGVWNGGLAINFLGNWFAIVPRGLQGWDYQPVVGGVSPLSVAPVDSGDPYVEDPAFDEDFDARREIRRPRPATRHDWRTRQYVLDIGGRRYDVTAEQRVYDHRVDANNVQMRGDVKFIIRSPEPADGSTWNILLTPKRVFPGVDPAAVEPGATSAEEAGYSTIASPATLFTFRTVIYSPEVELVSASRGGGSRATQLAAAANPAVNNSVDNMFANVSQVYSMYEPEAVSVTNTLVSAAGSSIVSFDRDRSTQLYMATRHASGFSYPKSDRPLVDTRTHEWTFRQPIINYTAYWPFLGGVCGLSAEARSYLEGSFQLGATQCFDGIFTNAWARGSVSFLLDAGGGFGCNLLVASASAGLDAGLSEIFEFGSDLVTVPPKLTGYVRLYSSMSFNAHFKVRVLFWSKRWSKNVGKTTVFQREATWEVLPLQNEFDVCALLDDGGSDDSEPGVYENFEGDIWKPCSGVVECHQPVSYPTCDVLGYRPVCVADYDTVTADSFMRYPIPSAGGGRAVLQNFDGACNGRYGAHRPKRGHPALDLWAPYGSEIYPARDGTLIYKERWMDPRASGLRAIVTSAFRDNSGTRHELRHGYYHLSAKSEFISAIERKHSDVQRVTTNQVVGLAGQSGNACHNEHTHFLVTLDGGDFDPTWMFSRLPDFGAPVHGGIVGVPGGAAPPPPDPPPPPPDPPPDPPPGYALQ